MSVIFHFTSSEFVVIKKAISIGVTVRKAIKMLFGLRNLLVVFVGLAVEAFLKSKFCLI